MTRPATGNLAQRTLLDHVLRHPLTARHVKIDNELPTIRQVQRLGDDGLAPRLRTDAVVDPAMVEHCAALLANRRRGRGLPDALLPLKLAVDGYSLLPEYVKRSVLEQLHLMAGEHSSAVESFDTDQDVVTTVSNRRSAWEDEPTKLKRPPEVQAVINRFRTDGVDTDFHENDTIGQTGGPLYRSRDHAEDVLRDGITKVSKGGRLDHPELATLALEAVTGMQVDSRASTIEIPSLSRVIEWVGEREWDGRIIELMRIFSAGLSMFGTVTNVTSERQTLPRDLYWSTVALMQISDRMSQSMIRALIDRLTTLTRGER